MSSEMDEKQDKLKTVQQNILKTVPLNKRDIRRVAAGIVLSVLEGEKNSLEVDIRLRYLAEMVDQIRSNEEMKEAVLNEANKYPEKTFTEYGAEVTKCAVGTRYDYSRCEYAHYSDVLEKIKELNEEKKECEKLLQGLSEDYIIEETGEIIHPPTKTSKEGMQVKLL